MNGSGPELAFEAAAAAVVCPDVPLHVVTYESAATFVLALTIAGSGLIVGLTAVAAVLVLVVRRLNVLVAALRKETGAEARGGLLNGDAAKAEAARAQKEEAARNTTSCAEEDEFD